MTRHLFAVIGLATILLVGCLTTRPDVAIPFETDVQTYLPGAEVGVRLSNQTDTRIAYNICFAFLRLERENGSWESVEMSLAPSPDAACTMILNSLAPGESARSTAYLPPDLSPGVYRISTTIEDGEDRRVATNAFTVGP